ncbi:MAG: OsmC family peroxiredoxin [Bacteroidetes bacterium]|nr:OsmC family peroxiredoxin [Bacteroidota bacterium]
MKRTSTAVWHGSGKEGTGTITSQSKKLDNAFYAWNTRYEDERGTNPEELIAAAHAGCFTMKLSFILTAAGYPPDEIITTSTVTLEESTIAQSHLVVKAKVPAIQKDLFLECAERSKNECPVSKALNLKITMQVEVEIPVKVL